MNKFRIGECCLNLTLHHKFNSEKSKILKKVGTLVLVIFLTVFEIFLLCCICILIIHFVKHGVI